MEQFIFGWARRCSGSAVLRRAGSFAVSYCARPLLFPAAPALVVLRCAGSFAVSHCAGPFAVSAAPALLPFPAAPALLPFSYSASRSPARRRFIRFFRLSRIPAFACGAAASPLPAACASAFYPAARGLSHVCAIFLRSGCCRSAAGFFDLYLPPGAASYTTALSPASRRCRFFSAACFASRRACPAA